MFRFDREDKKNVVYWYAPIIVDGLHTNGTVSYELQVSSSARKLRLGQHLMSYLQSVAYATGMSKVMLTVQKGALAVAYFYYTAGYFSSNR